MTKEEKQKAIDALKISAPVRVMTQEEFSDYIRAINRIMDLLELEPCDDAISRQAVLDATVKKNSVWNKITNAKGENLEQIILQLSPVNPQETVVEFADKCRECGARYGRLLKRFWYTGYKGLKNWTPISEGLPKEGETVIASTKYGVYPEARYTKEYGWEWAYEAVADYWRKLDDVEAWMPLPERYKPKEEQDERKTESKKV